jgi:beta-galactosidase GanA
VNDFIWARVKDICNEEKIDPSFIPADIVIKEFKSVKELTKENEELKSRVVDYEYILKENEELKANQKKPRKPKTKPVCADKAE